MLLSKNHKFIFIDANHTDIRIVLEILRFILLVLEIHRFKSVQACRPKARQAKVNENSSANSLKASKPAVQKLGRRR
ncbi:MAG: hypothetical protein LBP59_19850 [Planctomycetaceae bacterium]|jgi:hypothetical protein|nr:hypothetical protein [Planctomycetaceae bacterium]